MSVLLCTPCYGGQVTAAYLRSALALQHQMSVSGFRGEWLHTSNESLITRARNTMAATFLKGDWDSLFFIDADIEFSPDDVAAILEMDADVGVGVYPMKRPDAPYAAWANGKLVADLDRLDGPLAVDYAGTGFMCIKRRVLEKMRDVLPIAHQEGHVGECWAFFDTGVEDGIYLSEDYWFCKRWRELGGEITMNPGIRLKHWGSFAYGS